GADVPAAVGSHAVRVGGIGERLEPVQDLPALFVALANPGVELATAQVFSRFRSDGASFGTACDGGIPRDQEAFISCLHHLNNDLEPAALGLAPVLAQVLADLRRTDACRLARMSGS